jgi:hypothetical protein
MERIEETKLPMRLVTHGTTYIVPHATTYNVPLNVPHATTYNLPPNLPPNTSHPILIYAGEMIKMLPVDLQPRVVSELEKFAYLFLNPQLE